MDSPGGYLQACAGQRTRCPMFRFWVAGAAFSSFVFSVLACAGAELSDSSASKGAGASTVVSTTIDSPIVTPTSNAAGHFSGATGLEPFSVASTAWGAPASTPVLRSLVLTTGGSPASTSTSVLTTDPLQWTDARRAMTSYLSPSLGNGMSSRGFVSVPSNATFAPTTRLYVVPATTH
jgi:hypothetical protein